MSNTTLENANKVVSWIESNHGYWNSDVLEIKESKVGGIGVFAKKDLDPTLTPELLLRLPKESILSAEKSSIANLILEEEIEGALALIIGFIYEKHYGNDSPWFEYIDTIHYKDSKGDLILPPSLWTKKEKLLFKGSELEIMGALDDEENKSAYENACTFALNQHEISSAIPIPWELDIEGKDDDEVLIKYKNFIAISHAIASRDFEIDAFHQVALVPGADLFNHTNKPTVRFESVFDVCGMCGSSAPCDHMQESDEEQDDSGSEDGENFGDEEMVEEEDDEQEADEQEDENESDENDNEAELFKGDSEDEIASDEDFESEEEEQEEKPKPKSKKRSLQEDTSASKKAKKSKKSRFSDLPVFASADDYAQYLDSDDEDYS